MDTKSESESTIDSSKEVEMAEQPQKLSVRAMIEEQRKRDRIQAKSGSKAWPSEYSMLKAHEAME